MFKTLFELNVNFDRSNTIIFMDSSYRVYNNITDEEKVDYFISKFAQAIIEYKDHFGLGNNIYNININSNKPLKTIEDKYLIVINIDYTYEETTMLQNNCKQALFLYKNHEDQKLDKNILKNLWFLLFKNDNYPEILNYTDDIIYDGCKMDNSKELLKYVCRSSFPDPLLFINGLESRLSFIKACNTI